MFKFLVDLISENKIFNKIGLRGRNVQEIMTTDNDDMIFDDKQNDTSLKQYKTNRKFNHVDMENNLKNKNRNYILEYCSTIAIKKMEKILNLMCDVIAHKYPVRK